MSAVSNDSARTIEPGAIRWAERASPVDLRCPACGSRGPHSTLLEVPALAPPHQVLALIRCGACASAFYDPPDIRDFSDLGQQGDRFWRFYLDVGGGVWETIWPLQMRKPLLIASDWPRSFSEMTFR